MRGAARDHDLADAEGVGLVLVELERGDELACERLQLAPRASRARSRAAPGSAPPARSCPTSESARLTGSTSDGAQVERAGDRDVERRAAPVEHARELADAAVGDGEGRAVVADRDDDQCRVGGQVILPRAASPRARSSANASRSIPTSCRPALLAGVDVAVDELAVGDDEQDAADRADPSSSTRSSRTLVVEHRLVERDRQRLLGAEANRVRELLRVVDPGDLEGADADPVVGDAEPHAAGAAACACGRTCFSASASSSGSRSSPPTTMPCSSGSRATWTSSGRAVVDDAGGGDLGAADLQADQALRALVARVAPAARRARLGLVRRGGLLGLRLAPEGDLASFRPEPFAFGFFAGLLLLGLRLLGRPSAASACAGTRSALASASEGSALGSRAPRAPGLTGSDSGCPQAPELGGHRLLTGRLGRRVSLRRARRPTGRLLDRARPSSGCLRPKLISFFQSTTAYALGHSEGGGGRGGGRPARRSRRARAGRAAARGGSSVRARRRA